MSRIPYDAIDWSQIKDDDVIQVERVIVHRGPAKWVKDTLDRRWTAKDPQLGTGKHVYEKSIEMERVVVRG